MKGEFYVAGNLAISGVLGLPEPFVGGVARFLELLRKARELARKLAVAPILPPDFCQDHIREIQDLDNYFLLWDSPRRPFRGKMTMTTTLAGARKLLQEEGYFRPSSLRITKEPMSFLGESVRLPAQETEVTYCLLSLSREELSRKLDGAEGETMELDWVGTDDSELIVRPVVEGSSGDGLLPELGPESDGPAPTEG